MSLFGCAQLYLIVYALHRDRVRAWGKSYWLHTVTDVHVFAKYHSTLDLFLQICQ